MKSSWIAVVGVLALGAGCGGTRPLEAFKERDVRIGFVPSPIDITMDPAGRYTLFITLREQGMASCTSLSPDVVVTVNGDPNVRIDEGGCAPTAASSPMFTYALQAGDVAQDATIVIADDTHRMEVEVDDLLAAYRLQPRKAGFETRLIFEEGTNPVARGEVLVFDRIPALRDLSRFEVNVTEESARGTGSTSPRSFDSEEVSATRSDARVQLTVPPAIEVGPAMLSISTAERPAVTRCEGARSCEAEVDYGFQTTITVQP